MIEKTEKKKKTVNQPPIFMVDLPSLPAYTYGGQDITKSRTQEILNLSAVKIVAPMQNG